MMGHLCHIRIKQAAQQVIFILDCGNTRQAMAFCNGEHLHRTPGCIIGKADGADFCRL